MNAGPRKIQVPCRHNGQTHQVEIEVPDSGDPEEEQRAEAAHYVQTLADNQQIAAGPGPHKAPATHVLETGEDGVKRLKRIRFSAI